MRWIFPSVKIIVSGVCKHKKICRFHWEILICIIFLLFLRPPTTSLKWSCLKCHIEDHLNIKLGVPMSGHVTNYDLLNLIRISVNAENHSFERSETNFWSLYCFSCAIAHRRLWQNFSHPISLILLQN